MISAGESNSFYRRYLAGYLQKEMILESTPIHLANFNNQGHFTWNVLDRVFKLINVEDVENEMIYEDPWTKNKYYFWYPEWLLVKEISFYQKYINTSDKFWSVDGFKQFIHTNEEINSFVDVGSLARAFLGHGYTTDYMPYDGKSKLREFVIRLDNDDYLFGHGWEWIDE